MTSTDADSLKPLDNEIRPNSPNATEPLSVAPAKIVTGESLNGGKTIFSSHPISRFKLGRFQFANSILSLEGDEVEEFEKMLDRLPAGEKSKIKKIDVKAAELLVRVPEPSITGATDSSVGRQSMTIGEARLVGDKDIGHAKTQGDNNDAVEVKQQ
jgi:hypothetical protein